MYNIWRTSNFLLLSADFIWRFILLHSFVSAGLALYLIWWRDTTNKGAKKNITPNKKYAYSTHKLYLLTDKGDGIVDSPIQDLGTLSDTHTQGLVITNPPTNLRLGF